MDFEQIFSVAKDERISGRYITNKHIEPLIDSFKSYFEVSEAGRSVLDKPIFSIRAGNGKIKIFIWSQMHGNESTTTKAVFDFLDFLKSSEPFAEILKQHFTFFILPLLNPDGAELYTRENANGIDLNRDSVNLTQPESILLRKCFEEFRPDFAYNMHDQRSIFGVGDTGKPATVSFLAPSYNEARDVNEVRQKAINLIVAMDETLQQYIPGQVGRFDDSFNINCIGDMFQSLGVPTVLFEAGHYRHDYDRDQTRKYIFIALLSGFIAIYENVIVVNKSTEYFNIPQNKISFYDIICKNVKINYENKQKITNFACHYKEVVFEDTVIFEAFIREIGNLDNFHGHREYDCEGAVFIRKDGGQLPKIDDKADFSLDSGRIFVNGQEEE